MQNFDQMKDENQEIRGKGCRYDRAKSRTKDVDSGHTNTDSHCRIYSGHNTITAMFLLTLRRFNSNPSDFSVDLLRQSKGFPGAYTKDPSWRKTDRTDVGSRVDLSWNKPETVASTAMTLNETGSSDEELFLRAPPPQLAKRRDVEQTLNDSSSSDDELVLRSPRPNWGKSKYEGQMKTIEEADRELLIPMLEWQRPRLDDSDTMLPESPEHSSSPLYEVELTASDEEEGSIIELVMPLKSRHGPDATFIPSLKDCREIFSYMIKLLCCWNSSL
ncbi:jg10598 [Pararge aegeria aegeria]|uniref:Jg10598 protein n=1 Tax=Pararge aegeria aegeria TaxID=348720 RepID=A0A8S4S046_9NEOP|nr:jg10598 [Pararge aegeria aegeria]